MPLARRVSALAVLAVLLSFAGPLHVARAATLPDGFTDVPLSTGAYDLPVAMAWAPDGRMFVAEKEGRVRVAAADGTLRAEPLVDWRDKVNSYSDRGLLGIATDKDFATNHYLYLLYVLELQPATPDTAAPMVSRLGRVTVSPGNVVGPETVILGTDSSAPCPTPAPDQDCIPADFMWHVIGTVRSDPADGTLWIGTGDTHRHRVDDLSYRPLDETSYVGKIIHVDRDGKGLPGHPFCPAETDLTMTCTKLYAKGFRNPYRFTLRPGKGPVVGDVGSGHEEELDLTVPGGNYGWPCYEGAIRTPLYESQQRCVEEYAKEGTAAAVKPPAYRYLQAGGAAVVAGPAYSGATYPGDFTGDVFVGDYVQGWIRRLEVDANDQVTAVHPFATGWAGGVSLEQTPGGDLAYADLGFVSGTAGVRRFAYLPDNELPIPIASATPVSGEPPLTVQFTGSGSSDPDGDPLTYEWDFGDGSPVSTVADPSHEYAEGGTYVARLTVDDGTGRRPSTTVTIQVGDNAAPTASIVTPPAGTPYVAGERVDLTGSGTDAEDGALPDSALTWQVLLHHGAHVHPSASLTGSSVSFVTANDHDADSFYEIRLTARDSAGLANTVTRNLLPSTAQLTLASSPAGAPLTYADDAPKPAPFTKTAAVGFATTISAPERFVAGDGKTYVFEGWSDNGLRQHGVTIQSTASTLTALYRLDLPSVTLTFTPVADTYVDSSNPTVEKSTSWGLEVDGSPQRQSFLRFDVSGLAGRRVLSTRLRLRQHESSPVGGTVSRVSSTTWPENVNWGTKPAIDGPALGSFSVAQLGNDYETSLASGVSGDGLVSFALTSTHNDGSRWASRESPNPPQLIVTVEAEIPPGASSVVFPQAGLPAAATGPGGSHRIARTAGGRLLAVHGTAGGGVQVSYRDGEGPWLRATTGSVPTGLVVPADGRAAGTEPVASIVVAPLSDSGPEHAWVIVSAPATSRSARPLVLRRLSSLDAATGPSVGPLVTLDAPPLGAYRADLGVERAPDGSRRVAVVWTRRSASTTYELMAGWLSSATTNFPALGSRRVLDRSSDPAVFGSLVPSAAGLRIVGRAGGGALRAYSRSTAASLTTWSRLSGTGGLVGTAASPAGVALASGELLVATDAGTSVRVVRFTAAGAAATVLTLPGHRQPSLTTDGSRAWLVAVRSADGAVVSRERAANGSWLSQIVELAAPASGSHAWPNALPSAATGLQLLVRTPAPAVLAYRRSLT